MEVMKRVSSLPFSSNLPATTRYNALSICFTYNMAMSLPYYYSKFRDKAMQFVQIKTNNLSPSRDSVTNFYGKK